MKPDLNLNQIMKQAKEMQDKMQSAQKKLQKLQIVGKAGTDPLSVKLYAEGDLAYRIEISDELYKESKEVLEDMIVAAINDAKEKFNDLSKKEMTQLTASMGLPTDFNFDDMKN